MKKINEIMVVDDDPTFIFLTKKFVEIANWTNLITTFSDGKEAFDELQQRVIANNTLPDFIFLDITMPVWDAWKFLEALKTIKLAQIPVIYILTSSANRDDKNMAANFGLEGQYLEKPISLEMVTQVFEKEFA